MRTSLFISAAIILLLIVAERSVACTCKLLTVDEAFAKAEVVFSGRIVAIENDGVRFKVKKAWKGVGSSEVKVFVKGIGTSCDPGIRKGRDLLVYAYAGSKRLPLMANCCSRILPLKVGAEDVIQLNKLVSTYRGEAQQALGADSP
jgi:hypothetical protein